MRHITFPMICISIALLAAGCGTVGNTSVALKAASIATARSASSVETGTLPFDKGLAYKAIDILGVGAAYGAKLQANGINTVSDLLDAGAARTSRAHLVAATGISEKLLMTWVGHADLMRVTGCGPEYANLLERAGVDTVPDLQTRNPLHLAAGLVAANNLGGGKVSVHRLPDAITLTNWINNAKTFERKITY